MQTALRVEWTALHYIFPDSIASPVGNITPLLKAGEDARAISAAGDAFLCRLENRDDPENGTLLKCATILDLDAENVDVLDLRLEDDDELVVSVAALYVIEFNDTRESREGISERLQQNRSTAACFVPYLLLDDGRSVWSACEPICWESVRVTMMTSTEI